ncbi:MAG: hypothetical protein KAS18_10100, partial [Calditrichia bacterium]|nr:hypothetical protein [Calditrichia bacterium]
QRKDINPLKYELESFIDAINANIAPIISGVDGLEALKLAKEVMKKIDEHTHYVESRNKS